MPVACTPDGLVHPLTSSSKPTSRATDAVRLGIILAVLAFVAASYVVAYCLQDECEPDLKPESTS